MTNTAPNLPEVTFPISEEARDALLAAARPRLDAFDASSLRTLYDMLRTTVDAELARADVLDQKATVVLGYCGAIATVVIPWCFHWILRTPLHPGTMGGAVISEVFALGGIVLAFLAFRARGGWTRPQPNSLIPLPPREGQWSEEKGLRFWALMMLGLGVSHTSVCNDKGTFLLMAQIALVTSVGFLGLTVIGGLFLHACSSGVGGCL